MSEASRHALRLDEVVTQARGDLELRFPLGQEERAEAAAALVELLRPVVARYLGAPWQGPVRLELLGEPRASGANPATSTLRHALNGFDERSPRTAGALSYELGRILFYAITREPSFPAGPARHPDWLPDAALLPLRHVWADRAAWLDAVAEQVALFRWRKAIPEPMLRDMGRLNPRERVVASAQCLLRGQTLARHDPDWIRRWCAYLASEPEVDGETALERVTGVDMATWEERFSEDLRHATATLRSTPATDW